MEDAATQLTSRDMIIRKITKMTICYALRHIAEAGSHSHCDHTECKVQRIAIQSAGTPVRMLAAIITTIAMLTAIIMPTIAYADTAQYQMLDGRKREDQITVNKVWDDGLFPEDRQIIKDKTITAYTDLVAITVQTGVPQITLRTYTITYDANGGSYGTDTNGNTITTNTITYNAKNQPTNGVPTTPERTDGYLLLGWSTDKNATNPDTNITITNTPTDSWMNTRTDGSSITLYAVWKDIHINYAVMAYGIGVDKDANVNGNTMGITFGPALGYPEFSPYNNGASTATTQTFTKSHSVNGDATVMSENAPACTDDSHSVITGADAGTDAAGNAYRCLHYDNWATIIYWNNHDPNVYAKCIPNHCSKTVTITPNAGTIANGIFTTSMSDSNRGLVGDGQSYIVNSQWDNSSSVDITQAGQGYAASLVRAKLIGADSHTKLDDNYAGVDALTRYTADSSILSCFPSILRDAIGAKALSGVSAASSGRYMSYDEASNAGVADKLWLFSWGEMTSAVYPSAGFSSSTSSDSKRSSKNWWWLRSPSSSFYARSVRNSGYLYYIHYVDTYDAVAPGFTLPSTGL